MKRKLVYLATCLTLCLAGNASATVLDFETLSAAHGTAFTASPYPDFTFTPTGASLYVANEVNPGGLSASWTNAFSGDKAIYMQAGANGTIEISSTSDFILNSIQLSGRVSGMNLTFTGSNDGTTVTSTIGNSISIAGAGLNTQDFNFAGMIDKIVISTDGALPSALVIDNITFNEGTPSTVPEPSSFILLGAGLVGAYVIRRKKTQG